MKPFITDYKTILTEAKTIAVIGCSPDPYRTSNYIADFLLKHGYKVIPVNPGHKVILEQKCYPALNDIPDTVKVDIVNIFRNSEHTAGILNEVKEWKEKTGQNPVVWTQLDVSSVKAEQIAEAADIPYVRNRCIMVERERI